MTNDVLAQATGCISVVEKGEKGATERPRKWEDIPSGDSLQCGAEGEQYIDIVFYSENWYQCIKSFTKGNGVVPTNTIYFKSITDYQRLATNIFLAHEAYIHNLVVDKVNIVENGEVLLRADKEGVVGNKCVFNDATVSGVITNVGTDYTIKIDNGVIYFITPDNTYHLGLDSNGKPDWLNNKTIYSETLYQSDNLRLSTTSVTLYTTDKSTYYTDPNLKNIASGTYYKLLSSYDALIYQSGVYYILAGAFTGLQVYQKYTFTNGKKTIGGYKAVGYNFYLSNNKIVKTSSKVFYGTIQADKNYFPSSATIRAVRTQMEVVNVSRDKVGTSGISGDYIYSLTSNGNTDVEFTAFTSAYPTYDEKYEVVSNQRKE